jgi:hypothetical protein
MNATATALSNHAAARLKQRGIREADVGFLIENGTKKGDHIVFTNKDFARLEKEAKRLLKLGSRLKGKCLVVRDNLVVTGYQANAKQIHEVAHH